MVITQDFKEFIESLNGNDVKYLVIGGFAVAFHGHPRYTKDLDIWVNSTNSNVKKLLKALNDFGFGSLGLTLEDFLNPENVIQLGCPPNRIDLVTEINGVNFELCYVQKVETQIDGLKVNFIDLKNLKKNKKATGRAQDLADLENLK
ncbi:MAG: hypothetical protein E2O77_13545 [Caldithrix sp.]|nr:MAG: hypothetical protein E2O77_13545 [Caldithrix sp.]